MIRRIRDLWGCSATAEFESSFGLSESLERLKAATRRSVFSPLTRQEAVGTVSESHVSLQRVIPMVGNSFKPFFRGRFTERNGKVILAGRFTMHPFAKAFMAFWFGIVGCFTLLTSILVVFHLQKVTLAPLFGFGMIVAGSALVIVGKWFARNDAAWLSEVIRGALRAHVLVQATHPDITPGAYSSPQSSTTITLVTVMLLLMAALGCAGAIFGVQSAHTSRDGFAVTYFPDILSRYITGGLGIATLILALGIYRRRLLAWRAGFVFLAASLVYSVAGMLAIDTERADHGIPIIFCVASLLVIIIWGRWWYAQRVHFHD